VASRPLSDLIVDNVAAPVCSRLPKVFTTSSIAPQTYLAAPSTRTVVLARPPQRKAEILGAEFDAVSLAGEMYVAFKPLTCVFGWEIISIGGGIAKISINGDVHFFDFIVESNRGYLHVGQILEAIEMNGGTDPFASNSAFA
jgi:hypothetical protein